jgi:hypothetical protein
MTFRSTGPLNGSSPSEPGLNFPSIKKAVLSRQQTRTLAAISCHGTVIGQVLGTQSLRAQTDSAKALRLLGLCWSPERLFSLWMGESSPGHSRVEAAKLLGIELVPTLRLSHLSEAQRRAYVIADNKLAQNAGIWNNPHCGGKDRPWPLQDIRHWPALWPPSRARRLRPSRPAPPSPRWMRRSRWGPVATICDRLAMSSTPSVSPSPS